MVLTSFSVDTQSGLELAAAVAAATEAVRNGTKFSQYNMVW
jgi:hypothetical protein